VFYSKGDQLSPFYDDTSTSREAIVKNLGNGKRLRYSLLVPHMIERYGFYEGKGTRFRVEPRRVVEVFELADIKSANQAVIWWTIGLATGMFALAGVLLRWRRGKQSAAQRDVQSSGG
jgi:hypothetical protein